MPPIIAACHRDHGSAAISVPQTRDRAVCDPDTMPLGRGTGFRDGRMYGSSPAASRSGNPVSSATYASDTVYTIRACFIPREGVADPWLRLA
jgi:hypothetical protein